MGATTVYENGHTLGSGGSGGEDGKPKTLKDNDQITFWAQLAGGSQAIYRDTITLQTNPGDINNDGIVDVTDLLAVLGAWGPCPKPCPPTCEADTKNDCVVDVTDLLTVLGAWG